MEPNVPSTAESSTASPGQLSIEGNGKATTTVEFDGTRYVVVEQR
jgi:hypothetical protein